MVWIFQQVKELRRQYHHTNKTVSEEEIQSLKEYLEIKKQFSEKPGTNKKHELKTENLLNQIEGEDQ